MKARPGHWRVRDESREDKHVLLRFDPIKPDHKADQTRESKSSFSPEEPKSKILRGYCGGQLIPCVQTALEEAWPNIYSHMYSLHKKGPGPISNPRLRQYPRPTSKRRDESYTPRRSKKCLWRIWPCPRTITTSELLSEVAGKLISLLE